MAKKFYAVRVGRVPGVYNTWDECRAQTNGFPCAVFKSFPTAAEARVFIDMQAESSQGQKRPRSEAPDVLPSPGSSSLTLKRSYTKSDPVTTSVPFIAIYTDGSCAGNTNVASTVCAAGWSAVAVAQPSGEVVAEMFGPVVTPAAMARDPLLARFDGGAEHGSNNTGELCGILEALLWAKDSLTQASSSSTIPLPSFEVRYDSEYAAKVTTGAYQATKNQALVKSAQKALGAVKAAGGSVWFRHVKGHSGDLFNDRADELAKRGASGVVGSAGRWAAYEHHNAKNAPPLVREHAATEGPS